MGKGARNRRIRKAMMGSKKAARRYRKDQDAGSHDVVGMKKIMEGAVEDRMGKSGLVVPKSGLIIAQLDEKSVDLDNPELGRQISV